MGLKTTAAAFDTPKERNASLNIRTLLVNNNNGPATTVDNAQTYTSFFLPKRSASIPMGMVKIAALKAFIMMIEPRVALLFPMEVK